MRVPDPVDVLILAGGKGSRLRSVTGGQPKGLALIDGVPFLDHQMSWLERVGIRRGVLCLGYGHDRIEAFVAGRSSRATRWVTSVESRPLGTAGALREAFPQIVSSTVLVLNGDTLIDMDLDELLGFHREREAMVSLALSAVEDASRFGTVRIDESGRVLEFGEKRAGSGLVSVGVYAVERSAIESIPAGEFFSLEQDWFPGLVGGALFGSPLASRFLDIGTPASFTQASAFLAQRQGSAS